jgi:phosphate transport system protein
MGDDLRVIVSSMRVSQDLERVGDLAKNIAKRALIIDGTMQQRTLAHGVDSLSRLVLGQLKRSIEAFVERDTTKAEDVWRHDAEVDALYTSLFRELLTYMMEDPRNISPCTHLLFCAKNLERIGDHATNIAERAIYTRTGEMVATNRPKQDELGEATPETTPRPKLGSGEVSRAANHSDR